MPPRTQRKSSSNVTSLEYYDYNFRIKSIFADREHQQSDLIEWCTCGEHLLAGRGQGRGGRRCEPGGHSFDNDWTGLDWTRHISPLSLKTS